MTPQPGSRFLAAETPLLFAHRGGAGLPANAGVENTLAAFGAAAALGCTHLETDARATADGVAVLCHDPDLRRLAGADVAVAQLSWAQLSGFRLAGREPFARLDELLDALPDALVNVDVKADDAVGPVLAALRRTGAADRVGIAAFGTRRAARLRRALGPDVAYSATPPEVVAWTAAARVPGARLRAPAGGPAVSHPAVSHPVISYQVPPTVRGRALVTARSVAAAHRAGRQVHVWTVDEPAEVERLLALGVDGIVTDRPDVVAGVLARRGSWPPAPVSRHP